MPSVDPKYKALAAAKESQQAVRKIREGITLLNDLYLQYNSGSLDLNALDNLTEAERPGVEHVGTSALQSALTSANQLIGGADYQNICLIGK